MDLKPGTKWKSAVCSGEVVVVRPPGSQVVLECGGAPMLPGTTAAVTSAPSQDAPSMGLQVGKRSWDEVSGLEVLCVKAGSGALAVSGRPLALRTAKQLPASD